MLSLAVAWPVVERPHWGLAAVVGSPFWARQMRSEQCACVLGPLTAPPPRGGALLLEAASFPPDFIHRRFLSSR